MRLRCVSLAAAAGLFFATSSFTTASNDQTSFEKVEVKGGQVKIVNDTSTKLRIHTGSGVTTLNAKGGSTSISCDPGRKIYTAPKGSKDKFIFEVESGMCGKTVKLSAYL